MPISRQETGLSLSRVSSQTRPESGSLDPAGGTVLSYQGVCHCGKYRFEVRLPEISDLSVVTSCNCSLCRKSGYLWVFPDANNIKCTRGEESTLGTFETEALKHEFCTFCGTGLYGTHKAGPLSGKRGVNVRAVLDVNPFKLDTDLVDTVASIPETSVQLPTVLTQSTAQTTAEGDNTKVYTGSCQCGAVAFAVKTPPLSKIEIKEDNCSICVRRAAISIYPDRDQVTLLGKENTTTYAFGRKFNQTPFCKTCGVACYGVPIGPPQALVDTMPEEKQKFVERLRRIQPLYVRAMDGVEWDEITIERSDEGTGGYLIPEE